MMLFNRLFIEPILLLSFTKDTYIVLLIWFAKTSYDLGRNNIFLFMITYIFFFFVNYDHYYSYDLMTNDQYIRGFDMSGSHNLSVLLNKFILPIL